MQPGVDEVWEWNRKSEQSSPRVYIKHIMLTLLVIVPAAAYQAKYYYDGFEPHFFFVPFLVSLLVGTLLGRAALLKQRLKRQGEQFRAIADLAQEFTYYRTADGTYEYVSPACLATTGYTPDEFYATPNLMDRLIHPDDRALWFQHLGVTHDCCDPQTFELRILSKDRRTVWLKHICAPVFDEQGLHIGVRSTNLDITQRKEDQARIERMAYYDALTDLPNRRSLVRRLHKHIQASSVVDNEFALLFLDLNRFKHINDSFGHSFGDRLLGKVAERLKNVTHDKGMVSRFGGDEFVILLMGVNSRSLAQNMASRLLNELEQPLEIDGVDLRVSASIGITFYPEDGGDEETLIRNADVAMYKTKRNGSGNICFYSSDYSAEAARIVSTEGRVQKGLLNREFVAWYQPKVDLASGRVLGMEALARWQHPELGMIPPGDFIPIAEETGQINELGQQLLEQVLQDMQRWQELGVTVPVAVNVSARQFADSDYCDAMVSQIQDSGCNLSRIELEITEQVFLGDFDSAIEKLQQLRSTGLSIALDDFGTGYSSFNYLKKLPIDTLKIDRAFITHIDRNWAEYAIIKALVSMCQDLNLDMVVEGVEAEAQKKALVMLGCRKAQGFYFYRPLTAKGMEELLMKQEQNGWYEPV